MKHALPGLILCLLIFAAPGCREHSLETDEKLVRSTYPNSGALNDTAAFIAGLPLAEGSSYSDLAAAPEYLAYRKRIDATWDRYVRNNLRKIEDWRAENLEGEGDAVFYPFSGPDILNAVAFFPDAREYVMMGLESPGALPAPLSMSPQRVYEGLSGVRNALRTLLLLNLFRTLEMQADLRDGSISNTTGIMMFFLARAGREILDIKAVTPPVSEPEGNRAGIRGVEFVFRKGPGTPVQRAIYLSVDISDASLKAKPKFVEYLREKSAATSFMKSASYLLGYDNFKTMRSIVMENSRRIVQDDTAVPFKHFDRKEWDITLYGRYRVLEMFKARFQPDLDREIKRASKGPLPFACGYGFIPEKSNLLVARRRAAQSNTGPRL
ncbi:MAG TPA: hypothetical protein PKO25_11585 [Spirochaetota bacterium]|nr:hypothetical protein [Spirochaetota bacterium]OPZ38947.1 MAG: hypothetical protein BWY96_00730 [Spirochaetes bacterium ADurb.BinA120]HNU92500.1 hypothetical protein [Spirochaetota bacterium]HPI14370.1 hypothetical protein [Spirochaetota bacterium]HPO44491.1 hypothetical protein [Spirochaetota bacterium]